jgi:hypothetical protein
VSADNQNRLAFINQRHSRHNGLSAETAQHFTFIAGPVQVNDRALSEGDTMSKTNGKRRAWTSEQVRTLKTLARKKTPAGKIARALRRTQGATRQKAFSLGLSLETRF